MKTFGGMIERLGLKYLGDTQRKVVVIKAAFTKCDFAQSGLFVKANI